MIIARGKAFARFVVPLVAAAALCRCHGARVGVSCSSSADCASSETCDATHACVPQTANVAGAGNTGGESNIGGGVDAGASAGAQNAGGGMSDGGSVAGSAGEAGVGAGGSGGGSDSPLGAHCVGCTLSPIGTPQWKPTGAVMAVGSFGKLQNSTEMSWYNQLLYPNHTVFIQEGLIGPTRPHSPPYDDEFYTQLVANNHPVKQAFSTAEFTPPFGVMFMVAIVPTADAKIGSSFDFASGPILPNALFPLHLNVGLNRNGSPFEPSSNVDMPGYDRYVPPILEDGASHLLLGYDANTSFGSGEAAAGSYQFTLAVTDTTGSGWELAVPFTVAD